ncbi:MAG TPA: hypothetical protein VGO59_19855 [Verrucomicrobiae bacterium]|jgi:hypothetical protein
MAASQTTTHRWRFFRAGGFDQVKLETGADLMSLDQLDQKLWVALACPISGLEFDPKTAALIDTDHDGRIRAPELIAAVKWAGLVLKSPDLLIKGGGDSLPLSVINEAVPEGAALLAAARQVLAQVGHPNAPGVSLKDAAGMGKIFAGTLFNGDGVIVPESGGGTDAKSVIEDIAACMGTVPDRSGKPGIDQLKADAFFAECAAFDDWWKDAERDADASLPLGEKTPDAAAAVNAIRAKVDDYFGRCRLAAFDSRATWWLNRKEDDYAAILAKNVSIDVSELAGFPLAQAAAGKPLPLQGAVNPACAAAVAALREQAVKPMLGDKLELTEADWAAVQARLAPFVKRQANQAGPLAAKLGLARVRHLLGGSARKDIDNLLAKDLSYKLQAESIGNVERIIRYVRDLYYLCVNFVNFKNLYAGEAPAIFQAGVLYLDQRSCHLCLTVEDAARHAAMAGLAGAFLAYADCVRKGTGEKMSIVAIFSQGDDENVMVGRNGIFYDRKGLDYDATITRLLPNPISLREAFWSPYKKAVRLVEEQVSRRVSTAGSSVQSQLASDMKGAPPAPASAPAAAAAPAAAKSKFDPSVVALISVAVGSLAAAFTTFLAFLGKFEAWQLPLLACGIMLIISGPSVLLAFFKLRRRNLGPILDANGWAINTAARINVPFGARMTDIAQLPPGSTIDIHDHYAEKTAAWPKFLAVVLFIGWLFLIIWDVGILYSITKDWSWGPLGKPPAADGPKKENAKTPEPEPAAAAKQP